MIVFKVLSTIRNLENCFKAESSLHTIYIFSLYVNVNVLYYNIYYYNVY